MAMDVDRTTDLAHATYWPECLRALQAQQIPADHIHVLKVENYRLIRCIINALIVEITTNAETNVTDNLNATLSALHAGSAIPNDGGAAIKSAMNGALPTTTTKRIS